MMLKMQEKKFAKETEYFLATTALEGFWDITKPMLFLAHWCRRFSRKSFWEPLNGKVIGSNWSYKQKGEAYHYCYDFDERLLAVLGERLNSLRGLDYSDRYWRIMIEPWLILYVNAMYDRYVRLRMALDQYPNLTTLGLADESFVTPRNAVEFVAYIAEDPYNLQLFTKMLKGLGFKFPQKSLAIAPHFSLGLQGAPKGKNILESVVRAVESPFLSRNTIALKNSYIPRKKLLSLFLKTYGKALPLKRRVIELPPLEIDKKMRTNLEGLLPGENEFEQLLVALLPLDLPQSLVEGYDQIKKEAERSYPKKLRAIFSANDWYYDEVFKHWAANAAENGVQLLGAQHGGNYGSLVHVSSATHELKITDRYYTWGWEFPEFSSKIVPMPATKFICRTPIGASNEKEGILFSASAEPRYLFQFPFDEDKINDYLRWLLRFLESIPLELRAKMRMRLFRDDFGWDMGERLLDSFPDLFLENWDMTFLESLKNCRLFVCDLPATTFAEALSVDKPTIMFWDPDANELLPEAEPYYDELRQAGILYNSPEVAARAAHAVYEDVESWWRNPELQTARRRFCDRFARLSTNAIDEWAKEFKMVAMGPGLKKPSG